MARDESSKNRRFQKGQVVYLRCEVGPRYGGFIGREGLDTTELYPIDSNGVRLTDEGCIRIWDTRSAVTKEELQQWAKRRRG